MLNTLPISIKIVIWLFLFTFLFSVALEKPKVEIIAMMKSGLMGRSLFANFILLPIVGLILIRLFHLSPEISIGFLAVAAAPGGLLALHFARVAKGNLMYAVGLVFLLSLLSIIATPILIHLIFPSISPASVPIFPLMGRLLLLIAPPLLAGQVTRHWLEMLAQPLHRRIAPKLQKLTSFLAIALFITLTILTSTLKALDTQTLGWNGVAAIATLIVAAWIIGWWLGGADLADRKVLAISTSMRNIAICLAIASSSALDQKANLAIIGFSELLAPMNLVFAIAMSRVKSPLA
ncbi:hypothetical protein JOY44_26620 (plasmid) [Phormidium sp. CLA17]|uniref:bile acid:sodium symporter family protein n=1 Tax=Leptolyngbya sp. Cla-17 TaxID=2803751 RepID=UPI001492EE75|nr:bile acid:sodium symporter [Leptolyngbya sp. Cla-17]MBM0745094.1 hypothetical protein [Leptolyngbya sp. Cla-17]